MFSIRSPLAALGAVMVLLEGISASALVPLQGQPELQARIVWMMIGTVSAVTLTVIILIGYFALRRPGLLFSPQDIEAAAHVPLYTQGSAIQEKQPATAEAVEFRVVTHNGDEDKTPA